MKVRLVADLSNFDYQMIILENDDEKAHIDRIGSKRVPFLETDDGTFIKDSDEICKF
ncbi:glutathione S-transferase N-terminal domain-containing protein, partial [Francisella tularensis subsp. holarctica]|nr:glutathione S-transferase N-terminal domain-containing protein [Francisella tularensis subsp. holarctica]